MSSLREAVRRAVDELARAGVDSARADALELAAFALGVERGEAERLLVLGAAEPATFGALVAERARRVPLQHLTGIAGFRRLRLAVGPGVFVPRPESELTAGLVIDHLSAGRDRAGADGPLVVDLGCGCGAIGLSIRQEVPTAEVIAVEISPLAAAWARQNIERLGLPVRLVIGDLATALPERDGMVEAVVSNPPYIPPDARPTQPEVRHHDPQLALYGGGADGLVVPTAVVHRAERLLRPGGLLAMEHADSQGPALLRLLAAGPWWDVVDHRDLAGRPRVVTARRG